MPPTIKQLTFSFFFLLSWLLLLLIGDSYINYVLLGGASLFLLLFSGELDWQKINCHPWLAVGWGLALLGIGLSFFFSINLPLSLQFTTKFIFSSVVFWFFFLLKKSFISSQQVIKLLLLISSVILLLSISFQFFPSLANLLPGMNLLHATYGHNHLAALLLLVIPLSWWLASESVKKGQSHRWWLLPLVFNLGLLFSFGRVAVAVGLVQFLVIFWQLNKNNLLQNHLLKFLLKFLLGLFLIILLSNTFFSTITLFKPKFACPVPRFRRQLCKSISTESRPEYWQWAVKIIQNNFWLGSGPGTFGLAAKKYYRDPFSGSAYAHNAFLEFLAEMGIAGGSLLIILMFTLLFLAWKNLVNLKKMSLKQWSWQLAAFLGVAAIYVDVLFDFDWEFIGIFTLTLMLLALVIKDQKTHFPKNIFSNFFKVIYFLLVFILIAMTGLYLKTDGLIKADKIQAAFQLCPYFHWHRKIYENDSSLSAQNRRQFYQIYAAQPAVYETRLAKTKDKQQLQLIKEQLFEIDPWSAVSQDLVSYYLDQGNLKQASSWLQQEQALYASADTKDHRLDYQTELSLGKRSLALAQAEIEQGDLESALTLFEQILSTESNIQLTWEQEELMAQLLVELGNDLASQNITHTVKAYSLAKQNLPWILSDNQLWFEKYPNLKLTSHQLVKYLQLTADWQGEAIGWKNRAQYELALQAVKRLLSVSDWENLTRVVRVFNWANSDYQPRRELVAHISLKTDELVKQKNYQLALQLTQDMNLILPNDYWLMLQPGQLSVLAENFDQAQQQYQQCLDEWRGEADDKKHWECETSLLQLNEVKNKADRDQLMANTLNRYFQVSKIIRGEAVWQDFD